MLGLDPVLEVSAPVEQRHASVLPLVAHQHPPMPVRAVPGGGGVSEGAAVDGVGGGRGH